MAGTGPEILVLGQRIEPLINIRPGEGNRSMEIVDEQLRETIREITFELIGRGEETG